MKPQTYSPAEIKNLESRVDVLAYLQGITALHYHSGDEYKGPCPKCGGTKRFHVRRDEWFCRDCTGPKWQKAIDLLRFLHGVDFLAAIKMIESGTLPVPTERVDEHQAPDLVLDSKRQQDTLHLSAAWREQTHHYMMAKYTVLRDCGLGTAGRNYLLARGLKPLTWDAYLIGYCVAGRYITLPWLDVDSTIRGLRYRTTSPLTTTRYTAQKGSKALLYGLHLLTRSSRQLVLVEGEVNAMSIWQDVVQPYPDLNIAVLSFGSEGNEQGIALARKVCSGLGILDRC